MEYAMKLTTKKYPKAAICFFLCLAVLCLTFYIDYQEVHAIFPAIVVAGVLIPEAVVVISGLLAAAGVTVASVEASKAVSNWYYNEVQPSIIPRVFVGQTSRAKIILLLHINCYN